MLILTKNDIKEIFTMKDAIQASKEALSLYSQKKTIVPLRINIDISKHQGKSLFMPAYTAEYDIAGIKLVSIFPNNIEKALPSVLGQMILLDGKTGEVCAMMDGTYLTQLRTGALQGAATDILSRKNSKIAVLFGTGGQAKSQLEALLNVRDLEEIRVCGRNFDKTQKFVLDMKNEFSKFKTRIMAVKEGDESIRDADIVTTITNSKTPVFDGRLIKEGTHINGMGSYAADMQELPEDIIHSAHKTFFDTKEGVLAEAGDFLIPIRNGALNESDVGNELGKVILNKIKGRETEQEITLFKSVGSAIFDLVTAFKIYQKVLDLKVGKMIEI